MQYSQLDSLTSSASPRLRALRDFFSKCAVFPVMAAVVLLSTGCVSVNAGQVQQDDAEVIEEGQEVTIVIALSAIPRGIVGHSGVAVGQSYWDYGPSRVETKQRSQSLGSAAGPWWDDPEQDWQDDLSLDEVITQMPERVHPDGSVVVVFRVRVTDAEAEEIAVYWADVYEAMRVEEADYHLLGWQCSNVVCHSLGSSGSLPAKTNAMGGTPLGLRAMTPTVLYVHLRLHLRNTAGPEIGRRAKVQWLELRGGRMRPYRLPLVGVLGG